MDASFTQAAFVEDPTPMNEEQDQYLNRWSSTAILWLQAHVPAVTCERSVFVRNRVIKCLEKVQCAKTISEYHHCVRVMNYTNFLMNDYINSININERPLYLPTFND